MTADSAYTRRFLAAWQIHYVPEAVQTGRPEDIDLPDDWDASLSRIRAASLGDAEMLEAIAITMARDDLENASLFRYFCGICWRTIKAGRAEEPRRAEELPKLARTRVREVACPYCGAAPGERCVGTRGKPRESNHGERVLAADAAGA